MSESESEQPEPTMEEILASIRRIISEDGEENDAPEADERAEAEAAFEEEIVLELTDVVEEAPVEEIFDTEPEPEPEIETEIEIIEEAGSEASYQPIPEELEPIGEDENLVSDAPSDVTSNTFTQLSGAMLLQGLTLDELVREMLKPMLKAWLDGNLPQIVERLVEREIARLSGGKPRD